jgi:hypothetical protein
MLFQELAVKHAKKQLKMVDSLTEGTPLLNSMLMAQASGGLFHVYEDLSSVTGGGFTDLNSSLTTVSAESELGQVDLKMIGGEMFVPQDTATKLGGKDAYFGMKFPPILRRTGMTVEHSLIYDSLRKYAIDNGHTVTGDGTTVGGQSSILAVTWVEGEISGLYDPDYYQDGIFKIEDLVNGSLMKHPTSGVNGYGRQFKTALGVLLANADYVSAYVDIDLLTEDKGVTTAKMDSLLDLCRAGDGNTVLYMHPSTV